MKKQIITATTFAAWLALCAAVWPQSEPTEETSSPLSPKFRRYQKSKKS